MGEGNGKEDATGERVGHSEEGGRLSTVPRVGGDYPCETLNERDDDEADFRPQQHCRVAVLGFLTKGGHRVEQVLLLVELDQIDHSV